MEVKSVANVVIQKLTDMLSDVKSIIGKKDIVELTEIKNDLEKLSGLFTDAGSNKGSEATKFAVDYLEVLYYVEDAIETFALRISLQQKRLGFLLNHALFLKKFTAYKNLKMEIQKIKKKIKDLEAEKCIEPKDASVGAPTPGGHDTVQQSSTEDLEDKKRIEPKDASAGAPTPVGDDTDQQSYSEDLEDKKRIEPKDASVGAPTPGGDDTDQQSSTEDLEDKKRIEPKDASVGAPTPGGGDTGQQSSTEDLEDKKRIEPKDASVGAPTPGGDDTDQQSSTEDLEDKKRIEPKDASVGAPTPGGDDTGQQSSTEDLEDKKRIEPKDASVGAPTPGGHDTNQQSSTEDVLVRPSNGRSDGSPTVMFKVEPHKSVDKSHSLIVSDRKLLAKRSSSYSYKPKELGLVGFDKHIKELTDKLTTKGGDQIVPLVGEKGSGKTTLAQAICSTKEVKDHFKSSVSWITIDKVSTAHDILLNLLKQVGSSEDQDITDPLDSPIDRLKESLKGKRFLIVLDDLRDRDTWGKIENALPDNKNGTKIIVTTRDKAVAGSAFSGYLSINRLKEEETLYLFQQKSGSECLENLKPKIVKICDGFPLNVVLLGSLLSTKDSDKWQSILDNGDWQKSGLLASCYNDTSDEEKLCLLYMVLFPKEYDVPVRRLLRLWLAEGFIKRPDPEDRVEKCFDSLVQRSLILITNQRSDGGHRKCQLLGALHEYLFPKAIDIKLFHIHRSMPCRTDKASLGARRLVDFVDTKKCEFASKSKLQSWRSYLSFNFQKKDIPAREVGVLLSNVLKSGFSLLNVLDLEGVYKPTLPDNLGNFYQLRYLGLRWTFLDHLPASVGDLTYLETLDLKHTNVNSLPSSVWKLNHLRHLNLNDIRLDMPVTLKHSLPGLITLCGLSIVERECPVKDGLDRLTHLRELDLTFQLKDCGELLDWVSASTSLEQLRLRSKNDQVQASTLSLKSLERLEKLSHMNFLGELPILLPHNQFPPNLKVLTLSVSELKTDPMETLGQLKHLTVLRLLANSYLGTKISCPPNGFKELRVVKLWMLKNLEDWELGENCMEKLNELSIRCCTKLKSVPPKLLKQGSFKELILNNMPSKFKMHAEEEKAYHVSVIEMNYNFTPLPIEVTMLIKAYEEEQQRLEVDIQVKEVRVSELQNKIQALKAPVPPDVNDHATTSIVVDQIEANPERETAAAMLIKAYEEEQQRAEVEIRVKKVRVSELQVKIQALKVPIPPDVNDHATTSIVVPTEPTPDAAETSKSPV